VACPKYNLEGPSGERAWDDRTGGVPNHRRFLDLADIALGLKKKESPRKKSSPIHETNKNEPYTN
jgi:hypothetical protein